METNQQSSTNTYASVSCNDSEESTTIVDASMKDGTMAIYGKPAMKGKTGGWRSGMLLFVIKGLAALAFTGVDMNMVLFSKSVLRQSNADAANTFSTWMGTLIICTLFGAFLSDSFLGRFLTCVVLQVVLVIVIKLFNINQSVLF
ncbi:Protein NRT1/PTR FAMILY 7.3 [Forsythia ovata]|uniref:Protein NRT1/PTR FAMILY 7.3 n=1 Tax=Forsythia ovata TaxID=205694 RepID=A0ABD1UCV3_9LAMI